MSTHSRKRALERYNLNLTKNDEKQIITLLRTNQFIPISTSETDKHRKFAYVTYKNIPIKVLYLRSNKGGIQQLITVYPFSTEEFNNLQEQQKTDFLAKIEHCIKFLKTNGFIVYQRKK